MTTLTQGKTLAAGDLSLLIREASGALLDPASITYTIFSIDANENLTLASQPRSAPARSGIGAYYIGITIPTNWVGEYRLVWYLTQYPGGDETQVTEDFFIASVNPASSSLEAPSVLIASKPALNPRYLPAIMAVRELLSDENPDRNYHFRPPTPGKQVAGYTTRVGFIWTDDTVLRMLTKAISRLNTKNPKNYYNWTLDSIPRDWGQCAAVGAAASCLSKEAARWTADEFGYSLNGVSLDVNKSQNYLSLAQTYQQEFDEWAVEITENRPFSAGLRQQRWLLG